MNFIPDTILRAACWTLLHSLWQGLLFALVAGIVMVLTKKASSALRYNLLCCLLILFLAVSGYTFYRQLQMPVTASIHGITASTSGTTTPASGLIQPAAPGLIQPAAPTLRNGIDSLVQYFNTHAALVVVTWFMIFLARFVKVLSGMVYAQRIRHYQTSPVPADWQQRLAQLLDKLQITRPVSLLQSALVKVPVVVGALKPVILVPIGMLTHLSPEQVESILIHELAHVRRRDYLFNLVQHLVDTLFFFNPALIWVSSLIRAERENCCDDIAIRETRSRRQLIEALVSFHEYRQSVQGYASAQGYAMSFAGKENHVVKRVKRIVHKKNHSLNAGERVLLMGGLLILSAAFITINNSRPAAMSAVNLPSAKLPSAKLPAATLPSVNPPSANLPSPTSSQKPALSILQPLAPTPRTTPQKDTTIKDSSMAQDDQLSMGFHPISLDKLIECKEHGVTADFVQRFRKMGYTNISPDQAIELKDHGVTAEFIKRLNQLGFSDLSLEKATELVDHGVTTDYIAGCKKRFGKLLELNDYIKLRDAGISPTE
jgi:bla regulator protein BlaR1